jgi:hypothetical protein
MDAHENDPHRRKDVRSLAIAIVLGCAVGAAHGIPRYGLFSFGNLAMMGLLMITVVSLWAAVVALLPSRPAE